MLNREDRFFDQVSSASIGGTNRKLQFGPFELSIGQMMLRREGWCFPLVASERLLTRNDIPLAVASDGDGVLCSR